MAYFNDNTDFHATTFTAGISDLYPDISGMLAAENTNTQTFDTLADNQYAVERYDPIGIADQKNYGKYHDHCLVVWCLTDAFQILWL